MTRLLTSCFGVATLSSILDFHASLDFSIVEKTDRNSQKQTKGEMIWMS
jgi:hypothetical protein